MNDTEVTVLRRTYASLLQARAAENPSPEIPLERILALVEGKGSEAERLATLDAAMAHPTTVRELELLRAVASTRDATRQATRAATRDVQPFHRRWRVVMPLLAAATLLVVVVPTVIRQDTPEPMRDVVQGPMLLSPSEEPTPRESRVFRWRSVTGARSYTLEILTARGTPLFTTRTGDTTVTLAPDLSLAPGVEHRWWVSSELSDGTQRRSAFRRLRVRAPQ